MNYDFTTIIDRRNCGSTKWNGAKNASTENVPLSVADMEFYPAPEIVNAIENTAKTAVLGYTSPTDEYYDAVISWMKRKHDFDVKKEWIVTTPGVVNALGLLIEATTKPADTVLILTPVYYPFDMSVLAKGRRILYSELVINNGRYEIDYNDFEQKCKKADALLFCNPHNPVGRVWTRDELEKVADICLRNDVFIIDDEIHNDIIMPGYEHTVMSNVRNDLSSHIAVCTAPSKTFNLAGLQCSNIIVPDDRIRAKMQACMLFSMQTTLNIFAYPACIAAYNKCEKWLDEMLNVVHTNAVTVEKFMAENFPEVIVYPLEGTYLQWLDVSGLGMTYTEMRKMLEDAGIYLDNGELFGKKGRGYQRINLACPTETIEKALIRFRTAVEKVRAEWAENGKPYHKTLVKGEKIENFVYTSALGSDRDLSQTKAKKTLIVFSRFYECELCRGLLALFTASYPLFRAAGCDIKFVVQSDISTVAKHSKKYPFELIADPEAKLYDKYNVFEADGMVSMVAGDKMFEMLIGKNVKKLLDTDMIDSLNSALDTPEEKSGPRENQLCAFVVADKDMNVIYSHYSKTMTDFPEVKDILKILTK